jgi:uncharacterized protein YijF (DUF1287 family)
MRRKCKPEIALSLFVLIALSARAEPSQSEFGAKLASGAARQIGVTTKYDPAYVRLAYPNGDVPLEGGVCSDVVVRAFRSTGIDLQRELHEDMTRHFQQYPNLWSLKKPDSNIDHRRVPNLMKFFQRKGKELSTNAVFRAGDVVAWKLSQGLFHIGIIANESAGDHPLVIHNIGAGAKREDVLYAYKIIGHYRW